jgi:dolichol-phosphate mannosyltransferase
MSDPDLRPLISIIIPAFNEEENIGPCHQRISEALRALDARYRFEILFMDNHSDDRTFERLEQAAASDPRVRAIRFSRNFGYQRSILTGYLRSRGAATIQLDCDLQDPPEMIGELLAQWERGFKVVYGIRRSRKESPIINAVRKLFYRVIRRLSEVELPVDAGDFRLVDRCIIEELGRHPDVQPYLRGAIAEAGYAQTGVPYDREERQRGTSKFNLPKLVHLAVDGIANHSIIPLRIASYTGVLISGLTALAVIGYIVARFVFGRQWPPGFTTLTVLILLSMSINAIFLGIIGEYLGRIYYQVKKSAHTIIERELPGGPPA